MGAVARSFVEVASVGYSDGSIANPNDVAKGEAGGGRLAGQESQDLA